METDQGGARPPTEVMAMFVDQHEEQYGVELICKQIQIVPSNYYERKARQRDPDQLADRVKRDRHLNALRSISGKRTSKSMTLTKSGGNYYVKVFALPVVQLNG